MLSKYNAVDIESVLRKAPGAAPFPKAADRAAWERIREEIGADESSEIIRRAEADAKAPIPELPATLYLDFLRTGQRGGYERPSRRRHEMMADLALAECLEGRGRFLDPLLNVAWAICEESSWVYPAHQGNLADMDRPVIDLFSAITALELAELHHLLAEKLDPALPRRIRYEVDRRCLGPYLARHDHWWLHSTKSRPVNNWSGVCNGAVVGAAIYLEQDLARLAEIIARGARSLDDFIATFDPDGGSSEGPGYWAFGFGYYVLLAHLVENRSGGAIRFLEGEQMRNIGQFLLRVRLSPGAYVNFSDCDQDFSCEASLLVHLAQRLQVPDLVRLAREEQGYRWARNLSWALRRLTWRPSAEPPGPFVPARHDWFSGMMWMIARLRPEDPKALVLAAKGGHNAEMHNQNDVGSIIVHVNGESVVADIGRGRYTRAYFSRERYEHFANSSLGHSVPVPNGFAQLAGGRHRATLLEHRADATQDSMVIEIKDAYPAQSDLASLKRTVCLDRGAAQGRVVLEDEVQFAAAPGMLESVLITLGQAEVGGGPVVIRGKRGAFRVTFDAGRVAARVETVKDVDMPEGPVDVRRVVFAFKEKAQTGVIRLEMEGVS